MPMMFRTTRQPVYVDNEQIKLTATFLNNLATASIAIGVITPILSDVARTPWGYVIMGVGVFFGSALHYFGRTALEYLRVPPAPKAASVPRSQTHPSSV